MTTSFLNDCRYENTERKAAWPSFSPEKSVEICAAIRAHLKNEAKEDLKRAIVEFYHADDLNLAKMNIFEIARAAVKGKVRKLIIADGITIFGKIDKKTGGLSIHPAHLDHEDDDILDDLAQEVLAKGGEVVVATQNEIPNGRPILAIVENSDSEIAKRQFSDSHYQNKTERGAI